MKTSLGTECYLQVAMYCALYHVLSRDHAQQCNDTIVMFKIIDVLCYITINNIIQLHQLINSPIQLQN